MLNSNLHSAKWAFKSLSEPINNTVWMEAMSAVQFAKDNTGLEFLEADTTASVLQLHVWLIDISIQFLLNLLFVIKDIVLRGIYLLEPLSLK